MMLYLPAKRNFEYPDLQPMLLSVSHCASMTPIFFSASNVTRKKYFLVHNFNSKL